MANDNNIYSPFYVGTEKMSGDNAAWEAYFGKVMSLPVNLRSLMLSGMATDFLVSIEEKYRLDKNKIALISTLIKNLYLGNVYLGNLAIELQNILGLTPEQNNMITTDFINILISPVMNELKIIEEQNFGKQTVQAAPVVAETAVEPVAEAAAEEEIAVPSDPEAVAETAAMPDVQSEPVAEVAVAQEPEPLPRYEPFNRDYLPPIVDLRHRIEEERSKSQES